jgi:outer membrane protein OmpA-like peptidoglycan-associated protein
VRDIGFAASTGHVRLGLAMLIAGLVLCGCGSPDSESGSSGTDVTGGAPSPSAPDLTSPTTPSGLTATATSASQVFLGWSPSADNVAACPGAKETINGFKDDDGCPDTGDPRVVYEDGNFVVLDTIRFEHASADINPSSHSLLNQIALTLKANPEIERMRVEGHTDDTGSREVNMQLSEQRARAVRLYLTQRGVSPQRLRVRSFGPDRPRDAGTGNGARAKNRRVEFVLE